MKNENNKQEKNVEKAKNLSLTEIKKLNRGLVTNIETSVSVEIDGEEIPYRFTYESIFRKSKRIKVMDDIIAFYQSFEKNPEIVHMATPYVSLLVLKHFTSIQVPDDIGKALEVLEALLDLNIFDKILNALPDEQVSGIYNDILEALERMNSNAEETAEEVKAISEQLDNDFIKQIIEKENA